MNLSTRLVTSFIDLNRTFWSVTGFSGESRVENDDDIEIEPGSDLPDWDVDVDTGEETLAVGDRLTFTKTISDADVKRFALASGDTNPVHLDDDTASETRFGSRIAHGLLVSSLISAALARIPGTVVYLSQDVEFHNPVYVGQRVTAECEVVEALGTDRYRLRTCVTDDDTTVVDGEAVILIEADTESSMTAN